LVLCVVLTAPLHRDRAASHSQKLKTAGSEVYTVFSSSRNTSENIYIYISFVSSFRKGANSFSAVASSFWQLMSWCWSQS
jgi:hypothetical protein